MSGPVGSVEPLDLRPGQRLTVLGAARSGLAMARVLAARGCRVLLSDARPLESMAGAPLEALSALGVEVEGGGHSERALVEAEAVLVSPGVSVHHPFVQRALGRGIPVMGEVEVAWRLSRAPFLAVTGTNGKSTTATLLARMLAPEALLAGNIGNPLVAEVEGVPPDHHVVAEVSSFQLETVHRFRPKVAILTNLTPDHLDRHATMEEYLAAKARLFAWQGPGEAAILSAEDPGAEAVADMLARGRLPGWLPGFPSPPGPPQAQLLRFSAQGPVAQGAWLEGGWLWWRRGGSPRRILPWDFPGLAGPHGRANGLAAAAAALWLGADAERIARALSGHRPLHHRLEEVGRPGGVIFVDDSKATNPASVMAALESFDSPVHLVAGGKDKGTDFGALGRALAARVSRLILIGEAAPRLARCAREAGLAEVVLCPTLREAVLEAWRGARPGERVLLSPACASFDMFRSAEDRGEQFQALVRELERGAAGG